MEWWLYNSKQAAQNQLDKINGNIKDFNNTAIFIDKPFEFEDDGNIRYGFPKPDNNIINGNHGNSSCDNKKGHKLDWFSEKKVNNNVHNIK